MAAAAHPSGVSMHKSLSRTHARTEVDQHTQEYQATNVYNDLDNEQFGATFDQRIEAGVRFWARFLLTFWPPFSPRCRLSAHRLAAFCSLSAQVEVKKKKNMTKHKHVASLDPPALDAPLVRFCSLPAPSLLPSCSLSDLLLILLGRQRTVLGFEERDMKFKRRELVTHGLPEVDSVLRHLENKDDSGEDEDGSTKRRRRRREIRRSRHALFDTTHKAGRGRGMTPEDVYHNSLGADLRHFFAHVSAQSALFRRFLATFRLIFGGSGRL